MIRAFSMHFDERIVRTRGSAWGGSVLAFREEESDSAALTGSMRGHLAASEPA